MTLYQQPLSVAEQLWRKQGNLVRLGEALNLRADFAGLAGDSASVAELAQQALDLLPEEEEYQRGMSWMYAGIAAFLQGDLEEANKAFQTASALCKRSGNTAGLRLVTLDLAQVQRAQGKLPEAARLLNEIISQPDSLLVFEGQVARVLMSMIWREWNRLDEAEEVLQNVLEMVEPMKQLNHFFQCYPTLAIIRWEKGDVAGMQAALDQQAHLAEQMQDSVGWKRGLALRALLAVLSGDLAMAQIWRISNHPPAEDLISLQNEIMYLVQARLQVRLGGDEARQALAMLEQLQEAARKQQRSGSLIEIKMIQALGLSRLNDTTGAITALEESLSLALPGGYRRIYLDEGQPLIDLLNLLVRKPSLPPELRDYATQLLALVPDPQLSAWNEHATAANLKLIEPLTPREIEVLRLIRDGLSNREIAEKLYLTLNTVKVHAKNIFAKLDVESRTQAVHRAGELGLI
jgi:LuxR family maltose regulon positive regulatory protein